MAESCGSGKGTKARDELQAFLLAWQRKHLKELEWTDAAEDKLLRQALMQSADAGNAPLYARFSNCAKTLMHFARRTFDDLACTAYDTTGFEPMPFERNATKPRVFKSSCFDLTLTRVADLDRHYRCAVTPSI